MPGVSTNFVGLDDREAGRLATSHLIQQGCQRVAHIQGPNISTARGRVGGYKQALKAHGMNPASPYIISVGTSADNRGEPSAYAATMKLLAQSSPPDGIFCFNDAVAISAMRAILDAGLQIPEDVAVVGCGNFFYSDFIRVSLSSVDQSSELIGQKAAEIALSLIQSGGTSRKPTRVILRLDSSRVPPVCATCRTWRNENSC